MGATVTTVPTLTPAQFAARLAAGVPAGWSSSAAKNNPGGVLNDVLLMLGTELGFLTGAMAYADDATRIQTAQGAALDLASLDFFGSGAYAVPRLNGESDASFSARLLGAMLPAGATRPAMYNALLKITGFPPRLIELWRPYDTGVIDGVGGPAAAGVGTMYLDVDNVTQPARLADTGLRYQGLIQCVLPLAQPFGNNPMPAIDETIYTDTAGSSMVDTPPSPVSGTAEVYNAINRMKCEGTICWVQFVPAPTGRDWDQPGLDWDTPGDNWT